MTVKVFRVVVILVIGDKACIIVQTNEAVPADHLADHIIRQVPLVGTDGARVGVGRNERAAGGLKEVGVAGVV